MTHTAAHPPHQSSARSWLAKSEAWLDERGKGAWMAAMILGFVFFWPIGLALLFYMIWSKNMFGKHAPACRRGAMSRSRGQRHPEGFRSSGNNAFDAYKADTLRRLQEEQDNFEAFLDRLRDAKDKAEFDQFMDERASKARAERAEKADTEDAEEA